MNILGIQTKDNFIRLKVLVNGNIFDYEKQVDREMSRQILLFIEECLEKSGIKYQDLTGIVTFRGEGGYTSLRIGITVANTLASGLEIPIIGEKTENWFENGQKRLQNQGNDRIVLPIYKNLAVITKPRK